MAESLQSTAIPMSYFAAIANRSEHGRPTPNVEHEPSVRGARPKHVRHQKLRHLRRISRPFFRTQIRTRPNLKDRQTLPGGDNVVFTLGESHRSTAPTSTT
jgi:hypothetical protein